MIRKSLFVGAFALLTGAILCIAAVRAVAQGPSAASPELTRLIGNWSGQTTNDGVLKVTVSEDRILAFQFSGGDKDHGFGTFRLKKPDQLLYTPVNETDAEHWTYSFDAAGQLKLKMEEDNPKDVEEYTLIRAKP